MELIVLSVAILLGAAALVFAFHLAETADHQRALDDFHRDLYDPKDD